MCCIFVNNSITKVDLVYIKKFLSEGQVKSLCGIPSYEEEVRFIVDVQNAVLNLVPNKKPIPNIKSREPKDVYMNRGKYGACCDRSRLIEKILRAHCFETRHVFLLKSLLSEKSHAVSEIHTKKGWLVVDSNSNWISLDENHNPHSIRSVLYSGNIVWKEQMCSKPGRSDMKQFCKGPSYFLYGVYSRCGKLYPPFYRFCPNVNLSEILNRDNFAMFLHMIARIAPTEDRRYSPKNPT